ncbi:Protein MEF2BNB-like protein [Trichoplax sp. H2]|nr:Protein MEF2BNB-like protein [Trichoplax sp. H2]|eukprot:RDD46309.1 Protein MEF2BNB-like protein [Trichoplax sp. H2]
MAPVDPVQMNDTDGDTSSKTKKVTDKFSECLHILANEPSLGMFRLQEHVRKTLPILIEVKTEVTTIERSIEGKSFDADYALQTVENFDVKKSFLFMQNLARTSLHYSSDLKEARRDPSPRPDDTRVS